MGKAVIRKNILLPQCNELPICFGPPQTTYCTSYRNHEMHVQMNCPVTGTYYKRVYMAKGPWCASSKKGNWKAPFIFLG